MIRAGWAAGLLFVFVALFRGGGAGGGLLPGRPMPSESGAIDCEAPVRTDLAALERCLVFQPGDVELMLDLGAAYEAAGRSGDAERVYRSALEVDPRDTDARLRLVTLSHASGKGGR